MTYPFPNYGQQPYPYQDQLSQLRSSPVSMQGTNPFPMQNQYSRPDPSGLNWVQGEAGAKSWFVAPGANVLLMDSEAQRFYLKSADMNGVPSMRMFEYSEVTADRPSQQPESAKFVTAEEFAGFKEEVMGKLEELSAPVEVQLSRRKKGDGNEQSSV